MYNIYIYIFNYNYIYIYRDHILYDIYIWGKPMNGDLLTRVINVTNHGG